METSRQDLPLRTDISQKTDESWGVAEDAYLSTCLNNQKPYKNGTQIIRGDAKVLVVSG